MPELSPFRENLLARIIRVYGYEHFLTLWFAQLLCDYPEGKYADECLEILVAAHEATPWTGEGEY